MASVSFFFTALALAVVISLFVSYFVAMTVIPLFCARYLRPEQPAEVTVSGAETPGKLPIGAEIPRRV